MQSMIQRNSILKNMLNQMFFKELWQNYIKSWVVETDINLLSAINILCGFTTCKALVNIILFHV